MVNLIKKIELSNIRNFVNYWIKETKKIIILNRKPKKSEFKEVSRVAGLGIILFGVIGFIILLISHILRTH